MTTSQYAPRYADWSDASPAETGFDDRWGRFVAALVVLIWATAVVIGFQAALTVLVVLGLVLAVVGLRYPLLGIMGVGMLCTLDGPARVFLLTGGLLRWNMFNYLLALIMLLFSPLLLRLRSVHLRWIQALLVLLLVELIITPNVMFGLQEVLDFAAVMGLFVYLARSLFLPSAWYWMAVVSTLAGAGAGAFYYREAAFLPPINENAWSMCSVTAIFTVCLSFRSAARRPRGQLVLSLLATINVLWVFLSGSRGSFAIVVLCGLFLLASVRGMGRRTLIAATAIMLGIGVLAQFTALRDRTVKRIDFLLNPSAPISDRTSGRSDLARGGLMMFEQHPLGVGTGGFADTWEHLDIQAGDQTGKERQAHAAWIKILAENGVPGTLLLFGYTLSFAVAGLQSRRRDLRRLGLFVTCTLGMAFLTTEFQPKGLWLLGAGAIVQFGSEMLRPIFQRRRRHPAPAPIAEPEALAADG